MAKKKIKMRIVDDYVPDTERNFYAHPFIKSLQNKFDIVYSDEPDFLIYSQSGFSHLEYNCVRIFITGENVRPDYNVADYAIDFDYLDYGDRHLYHNLFDFRGVEKSRPLSDSEIDKIESRKFCCVLMSNFECSAKFRGLFFERLNAYKRVDSGGAFKNNVGHRVDNKMAWIREYKFNICFENSSYPGYLTEKLADAFIAGCVPIYWGDTSLRVGLDSIESTSNEIIESKSATNEYDEENIKINTRIPKIVEHLIPFKINPKAFINAHNFSDLDALVEGVKRVESDPAAFRAMLKEPALLDVRYNEAKDSVLSFMEYILDQEPMSAFRRGQGQFIQGRESMLRNIGRASSIGDLVRYYKLALFINKILKNRMFVRNKLKAFMDKIKRKK